MLAVAVWDVVGEEVLSFAGFAAAVDLYVTP